MHVRVLRYAEVARVEKRARDPREALPAHVHPAPARDRQEVVDVPHVVVLLHHHVDAPRRAVVRPALQLQQQQHRERHDGQAAHGGDVRRGDVRDVQRARHEDVDLAPARGRAVARRQAVPDDLVRREARLGRDEGEVAVGRGEHALERLLPVRTGQDDQVDVLSAEGKGKPRHRHALPSTRLWRRFAGCTHVRGARRAVQLACQAAHETAAEVRGRKDGHGLGGDVAQLVVARLHAGPGFRSGLRTGGGSVLEAGRCGQAQAGLISDDDPVQAELMLTCRRGRFRTVAGTRGAERKTQDGAYES